MSMTTYRGHTALMPGSARVMSAVCLVALATSSWAGRVFELGAPEAAGFSRHRRVRYGYVVRNTGSALVQDARVWIAAPVRQNATQWCRRIESSHDAALIADEHDNQALQITLKKLPPYGSTVITVEAELLLTPSTAAYSKGAGQRAYLQPAQWIESDRPKIRAKARDLRGSSRKSTARNVFNWVSGHVRPTNRFRSQRGALYALEHAEGDCTEHASLFAALCRASGVPSRCVVGFHCDRDAVLRPSMLHSWSEFHDGGTWSPVDCQKRAFPPDGSHYIAMRVGTPSSEIPLGPDELKKCSVSELTVAMKR